MGRVKGPRTYCKGYYFYSPQSSTIIKSKMAATTILRTRTRFRAPKIRLHCRLGSHMYRRFQEIHTQKYELSLNSLDFLSFKGAIFFS